jgi:hypothetical protein
VAVGAAVEATTAGPGPLMVPAVAMPATAVIAPIVTATATSVPSRGEVL